MPIRYNKQVIQKAATTATTTGSSSYTPPTLRITGYDGIKYIVSADDACYIFFHVFSLNRNADTWKAVTDCGDKMYAQGMLTFAPLNTVAPHPRWSPPP